MTSIYQPLQDALGVSVVFQSALLAAILLGFAAMSVKKKLASEGGGVLPDEGITLRNMIEVIVIQLATLSRDIMGEDWRKHFPVVGTIFFLAKMWDAVSDPAAGYLSDAAGCLIKIDRDDRALWNIVPNWLACLRLTRGSLASSMLGRGTT